MKKKSPKIKKTPKRKIGLVWATQDDDFEAFKFAGANCDYLIYFNRKKSLTSWVSLPSCNENKDELKKILSKIDEFRISLYNEPIKTKSSEV